MGQQLRRTVKRRRRLAYIERLKAKAKEAASGRSGGSKKPKAPAAAAAAE
jgi:hypothetical protein